MSGYYSFRGREPSAHQREDGELAKHIHRIFYAKRGVYGSPRVHVELREQGISCSKERVARLMREMELIAKPRPPDIQPMPQRAQNIANPARRGIFLMQHDQNRPGLRARGCGGLARGREGQHLLASNV